MRKVRIKTWEEMEKKFGLDKYGDILVTGDYYFTKDMENIIPNDRIIEIDENNGWLSELYGISKPMIIEYL